MIGYSYPNTGIDQSELATDIRLFIKSYNASDQVRGSIPVRGSETSEFRA